MPAPFSPTRFMGCKRRVSAWSSFFHEWPMAHGRICTLPFQMFSQPQSSRLSFWLTESSGSIAMISPSFTWHFRTHAESQHPLAGHDV